jgi:heme exporter protein B
MNIFCAILRRDLRLALRAGWQAPATLLFFLLVIVLLAFGVGPDPAVLQTIAPGAVWVAALLASLLSLDRLFASDAEDGSLDQLLIAPIAPQLVALAKMTAHFLTTGLPLAIVSPLGGLFLNLPQAAMGAMAASLLIGTPVLSLVGGAIAALLVGARRGGVLVALLALPLCIPVLIFGAGAIAKALAGGDPTGPLIFIAALLALALPLAPIAAAAALQE